MEEEKNGMSTGRKILIGLIAVLLLLTAAAYGYGVYYFSGHFLPGSLVNGFNCSYMDQKEAEELLAKKTAAYGRLEALSSQSDIRRGRSRRR